DQILEDRSTGGLDPRLVRAALASEANAGAPPEAPSSDALSIEASSPDDMVKHAPVSDDSLDPRLVRAALDISMDSSGDAAPTGEASQDALDPRLVRAALGVTMDSVEELESMELQSIDEERGAPSKPHTSQPVAVAL